MNKAVLTEDGPKWQIGIVTRSNERQSASQSQTCDSKASINNISVFSCLGLNVSVGVSCPFIIQFQVFFTVFFPYHKSLIPNL